MTAQELGGSGALHQTHDLRSTRPDVWSLPDVGQEWCDCGANHVVTRDAVLASYREQDAHEGRVSHSTVVKVTKSIWAYDRVCRFFHLKLEDAAGTVAGAVSEYYAFADAVDITGLFTKTWQGCPEEACRV